MGRRGCGRRDAFDGLEQQCEGEEVGRRGQQPHGLGAVAVADGREARVGKPDEP